MEFVVNEWFIEYATPDVGENEKKLFDGFFKAFLSKEDRLVVHLNSEFIRKLRRYNKTFQRYPEMRIFRQIVQMIFLDSNKAKLVPEIQLENDILNLTIGTFESDRYLFEAAEQSDSKIIVTTDERLQQQVSAISRYNVRLLNDFMKTY